MTQPATGIAADALRDAVRKIFYANVGARSEELAADEAVSAARTQLAHTERARDERAAKREELDKALAEVTTAAGHTSRTPAETARYLGIDPDVLTPPYRNNSDRATAAALRLLTERPQP